MTRAEFFARLAGIYPDELRHVLNGAKLADVFPVESRGSGIADWYECALCEETDDDAWADKPTVDHLKGCPYDFE